MHVGEPLSFDINQKHQFQNKKEKKKKKTFGLKKNSKDIYLAQESCLRASSRAETSEETRTTAKTRPRRRKVFE